MIKVRGFNRNKNNIGELFSLVIRNKYHVHYPGPPH